MDPSRCWSARRLLPASAQWPGFGIGTDPIYADGARRPKLQRASRFGINGQPYVVGETVVSNSRKLPPPAANWLDVPVSGAATLGGLSGGTRPEQVSGGTCRVAMPVLATFSLRPSTLNKSLLSSVGAIGPILLDIVIVSGVIFLILEIAALVTGTVLTRTITRSVDDLYEATLHVGARRFHAPGPRA